jgi:hypothetical protein
MSGKNARILRKASKLLRIPENYIKKEFNKMPKPTRSGYLQFVEDNVERMALQMSRPPKV